MEPEEGNDEVAFHLDYIFSPFVFQLWPLPLVPIDITVPESFLARAKLRFE